MPPSARNRLAGTVRSLDGQGPMAEVVVETDGGQEITAVITSNSADCLGLEEGRQVDAVIKATEVMVDAG